MATNNPKVLVPIPQELLDRIEGERAKMAPIPPRTETIRILIAEALDARFLASVMPAKAKE